MRCFVVVALWHSMLATHAHAACQLEKGQIRTVARVLDAETVQLDDGSAVRLAGIIAPRATDRGVAEGRWPPETAAVAALEALVTAKAVQLLFDATKRDRHGKLLAHLSLADHPAAPSIQEQMLAGGHARVDAIEGQRTCVDTLLGAETAARDAGRGLWSEPAYRMRSAAPARDIAPYQGTFQIIVGKIARVETGRNVLRLIFGEDRRRDLALIVRSTDRATTGPLGGDVKRLTGREVEVRGWVLQRPYGGPEIDVSLAGHIRLLGNDAGPAQARR